MQYGMVNAATPSSNLVFPYLPSPSVFADVPEGQSRDEGNGFFSYDDFRNALVGAGGTSSASPGFQFNAAITGTDATPFSYDANFDAAMKITTGTSSGNGVAVFTRPYTTVTVGSKRKIAAEIIVSTTAANAQGAFFGLVAKAGLVGNFVSNGTATATSNTLQSVSSIGFWQLGSSNTSWALVKQNGTGGGLVDLINGTATTGSAGSASFANALAQSSLNPQSFTTQPAQSPVNTSFAPPVTLGTTIAGSTNAIPLNSTTSNIPFVKLGLRFDGTNYIYFYVNGYAVSRVIVDSTFDQTSTYGVLFGVTAGTANAAVADLGFFKAAATLS